MGSERHSCLRCKNFSLDIMDNMRPKCIYHVVDPADMMNDNSCPSWKANDCRTSAEDTDDK